MTDLIALLREGRLDLFIVVALMLVIIWIARQWRAAEAANDKIQDARLEDVRMLVELSTEVKNTMGTLVKLIEGSNRRPR